jgi:transcriptional regulator with XRE-family HTH domain
MRVILKERRLQAGLTQEELCALLKRERTFVSTIERGTRMLDVLEFIDYAKAMGVEPRKLLGKIIKS